MKRAFMIAGGAVGGLGAVLAVTPPQLTSSSSSLSLPGGTTLPTTTGNTGTTTKATPAATQAAPTQSATSQAAPTKSATSKPVTTTKPTSATTTAPAASATPTATKTTAAPAPATQGVSGSFTGDPINVGYGIVQVKITVNNGKITDAQAVQAPSGRNDRFTQMAVPILRQKTLAAQGPITSGVSGASYTSFGWAKSLQSALSKAGL